MKQSSRSISFCCALLCTAVCSAAPPAYRITDIGRLPGTFETQFVNDINNNGDVLGYSWDGTAGHIFVRQVDTGTWTELGPAPNGGTWTQALGINDARQIVALYMVARNGETLTRTAVLSPGREPVIAPPIGDGLMMMGIDIDNAGRVIARSFPTDWTYSWMPGELPVLRTTTIASVSAMNDHGQIVGGARPTPSRYPEARIASASGHVQRMGMLLDEPGGSSHAEAVNNLGQACGYSIAPSSRPTRAQHAFFWSKESGMIDIGWPEERNGGCVSLNDAGEAVGTSFNLTSFYWSAATGTLDLFGLLDPSDPLTPNYTSVYPARINQSGQILVSAGLADLPGGTNLVLTPRRSD